eukprot:2184567-Rhodomonas_salina.1
MRSCAHEAAAHCYSARSVPYVTDMLRAPIRLRALLRVSSRAHTPRACAAQPWTCATLGPRKKGA